MNNTMSKMLSNKTFNKVVAIITALSLVFLQVPITNWSRQAVADASDAAQQQLAESSSVDVPLTFENAYITYAGQVIAPPATKVTIPSGAAMEFYAAADSGYQLETVLATINGTQVELSPDGNGMYQLTASEVVTTSDITVRGITAPTVDEVTVEEAPEAEAAGQDAAAEPGADDTATDVDDKDADDEEKANTRTEYTYEDADVTVVAKLSQVDAVPADAEFQVTPVTASTEGYNYDVYMEALNANTADVEYTAENTLLYDVAFMVPKTDDSGKVIEDEFVEYEPAAGTVSISITFKKDQLAGTLDAEESADIEVIHLPLSESALDGVDSTEDATNIYVSDVAVESVPGASASVDDEKVSFTVDSLSVYGVSTAGATKVGATPAASFTTGSTISLQSVAKGTPTSANLADFLTGATFNAPQNSDGKYVVTNGAAYTFTLAFAENQSLQFPDDGTTMYYQLPDGLNVADGQQGTLNIKVNDGGTISTVAGNRYWIQNGALYFEFNTSDPNYSKLTAASNAKLNMTFSGTVDESATNLNFKDGISKDIEVDTSNSVSATKSAWVDKDNNKVHYTVAVVSKGVSKNVVVSDVITGNALSLDASSIEATSNKGGAVSMTGSANGNAFAYTIGQMTDSEVVTFNYAADIDPTKIQLNNGKYVTTGTNSVSVKSDGDPTPDVVNRTTTIDYTPSVWKGNGIMVSDGGTTKTMLWTVTVNDNPKISMAGGTINDNIADESKSFMKYSGSGITVKVYDASGNEVRTDNVAWSNLTSKTDNAWTYTVPNSDSGKAYKYVVSYTTEVDMTGKTGNTQVKNSANVNNGNPSWNEGTVPGTGGGGNGGGGGGTEQSKVHIVKTAESVDVENREITWKITFNVPEGGLTKAVVTDTYPNVWAYNKTIREAVINGSVNVDGLLAGESYDINYGDSAATITFFQNQAKSTAGLKGGEARAVTVTLKTVIDDEWFESAKTTDWQREHKNTASIDTNVGADSATASAYVNDFKVAKNVSVVGSRNVDGFDLPIYKYEIVLDNVTSDVNVIDDRFDTSVLEMYDSSNWDSQYIFGGNVYYQGAQASSKFSYVYTADGIRITTSPDTMPHDSTVGSGMFSSYKIVYYLTVKDKTAYEEIMTRAAESDGGIYKLENTVEWNDKTDSADVTFEYAGLKKEILTPDSELAKTDEDIWADFRITLNPSGAMLNGGETMTMTDTYENLSIDFASITATPSAGVSWDASGNVVTYHIPDQTKVVIMYRARVVFDDNGAANETKHVKFSNVAEMNGFRGEVNKSAQRTNSGSGLASVNAIYLLKYEAGDMNTRLEGAQFALLDSDKNPVTDKWGNPVVFTTPADGRIEVKGDQDQYGWAIQENQRYYLRELVAPEGYMLAGFDYSFQVSEDGTTDYAQYIYHNGDTMTAKNYKGTDVKVQKSWSDGNENHDGDTVTVKLQQKIGDGAWSDAVREEVKNSDGSWVWQDTASKTVNLNKDSNWEGAFTGLPVEVPASLSDSSSDDITVTYRVVEAAVNGEAPADGTVEVVESKDGGTYAFTINNEASNKTGSITFQGAKTLAGRAMTANDVFEFQVSEDGTDNTWTVQNKADGTIEYPTIEYDKSGIGKHAYTVKETSTDGNGITVATNTYKVEVTVADNGGASLDVTASDNAKALNFANTYAASGSTQFKGAKTLTGRDLKAGEFEFLVTENGTDKSWTVTNGADGSISFPQFTYTQADAGLHTYTVKEVTSSGKGVTADGKQYTVTVNVADNGDGSLSVTPSDNFESLNFTNAYKATGSVTFEGAKTMDGRSLKTGDTYEFQIMEGDEVVGTATSDASGKITYPTITYKLDGDTDDTGEHTYTVKETSTDAYGVTVATNSYDVTVNVTDKGDGSLNVVASDNAKALNFMNTYAATGSVTFQGVKKLVGRDLTADDVFSFEVREGDRVVATVQNDAEGNIAYPTIDYTLADVGTHTYTVKETSTGGDGITADTNTYTVTVKVSDNGTGKLKVEPSASYRSLDFTNTYAAQGSITLTGMKTLTGRDMAEGEFSFVVKENGKTVATGSNAAAGNGQPGAIAFTEIAYTLADVGTHTYIVSESESTATGVEGKTDPYTVTVNVADNGDGTLSATLGDDAPELSFENTYTSSAKVQLQAKKTLNGQAPVDGAFSFTLSGPKVVGGSETVANNGAGDVLFTELVFDQNDVGGDFEYTISEVAGSAAGVTYDTHAATVKVNVTIGEDGKVKAEPVYADDAIPAFQNSSVATFNLGGTKTVENRAFKEGDSITFSVQGSEGAPMPARNEVTITPADGTSANFTFGDITYGLQDVGNTYTYTVTERANMSGVTNDAKTRSVAVTVTMENGVITATPSYLDEGSLSFTNTYGATGSVTFAGTKTLTGRDMAEGEFDFVVLEGSLPVAYGTNAAAASGKAGAITFTPINYTLNGLGLHTYTVREVSHDENGVTVDKNTYEVTVNVTDNGSGQLVVEPSANYQSLDFVNTYESKASVTFEGSKSIHGRDLAEGDVFSFQVKEGDAVIATVQNDGTGAIAYPTINYTQADAGTHTYTVSEVVADGDGITTDRSEYTVTVDVVDDGLGTLTATPSGNATDLDFINEYAASGDITFAGYKSIDGRDLTAADVFTFQVTDGTTTWEATNDATGKIAYPTISYTLADVGTKTYTVTEASNSDSGITVSEESYEVTVNIADNGDGTLKVEASDNAQHLDFTNAYEATGNVTFEGAKTLIGRDMVEGEFGFEVVEMVDGEEKVVATGSNAGAKAGEAAAITFDQINYTLADVGDHSYTVHEVASDAEGVTSTDKTYEVKVNVADNGNGTLKVTTGDSAKALAFTNTYEATGTVTLEGTKTLSGRDMKAGEFTFAVLEGEEVVSTGTNAAANADETAAITFTPIDYTLADVGEHTYTVKETSTTGGGVTVDGASYTVTVTIADNGDGSLSIEMGGDYEAIAFQNSFTTSTKAQLQAKKTVNGDLPEAGAYTFHLTGPKVNGNLEAVNDEFGNVTFDEIEFSTADAGKSFDYEITEVEGDNKGVTYDTSVKKATVTVSSDSEGNLSVATEYEDGDIPTFDNKYAASGTITFAGTKALTGRALTADDKFSFGIYEGDELVGTATSGADGRIAYPTITYTLNTDESNLGDHAYLVKELSEGDKGVVADTRAYELTVRVSDNGDGTLKAERVSGDDPNALNFTNTYTATGSVKFKGSKTLTGRDLTADDTFTFQVTEGNDVKGTATNGADGTIDYPEITYTLADVGNHTYTVTETSTSANGVTVSSQSYDVTVNVTDNGDGTLRVTASDNAQALDFTNTYAATGSITFEGTKTLVGRDLTADDVFTFQVTGDGRTWEATNDATGKIAYPKIDYTLADVGEHTYTVKEASASGDGITVDGMSYTVTVTVADNGDGTLNVTASDNAKALNFTNTYEAKGSVEFAGTKAMDGRALKAGEVYEFQVTEGDEVVAEAKSDSSGKIDYPRIDYTLADEGTHTYTVRETSTDGNGVKVPVTSHAVTVTVSDKGDGTLDVQTSGNERALSFVNTYTATGELVLSGKKELTGRELATGETFAFEVKDDATGDIWTVKSDADGVIAYPKFTYTLADLGDHSYTVREVSTSGSGVTADSAKTYKVTATVTDNGDGTLNVDASSSATALDFTNTYEARGSISISGTKTLTGRDLHADEFTFQVREGDQVVSTGKNLGSKAGAPASIVFGDIAYTLADVGEHTYTVTEVGEDGAGVEHDATAWTFTVEVADNGDGTLSATPSGDYDNIAFTNAYTTSDSIKLHALKTVNGAAPGDKTFTFQLTGPKIDGAYEATNNEAGLVEFAEIEFTSADAGQEFTYTITEVAGADGDQGITYDRAEQTVVVGVTADENGDLTITPRYTDGKAPAFDNKYTATGSITFEGTKTLSGRDMKDGEFAFEIREGAKLIGTATNDAQGAIAYPTITYTLADAGEHTYTVKEVTTDGNGVTVDTTEYTVVVNVSDNGDGTMSVEASDNAASLNFANTYEAKGSVEFAGTKTLNGRSMTEGEFVFVVTEGKLPVAYGMNTGAASGEAGAISFTPIDYTLNDLGLHTYTVREATVNGNGVTADQNAYEVTVNVSDNGNGQLVVEPSANYRSLAFTNTYEATGEVTFAGEKSIDTRALTPDDIFTFEIAEEGTGNVWTARNDETGKIDYPTIQYTLADLGEHTYQVRETSTGGDGVTVDSSVHSVTVTVADNGDGTLSVDPSEGFDALSFTNAYDANGSVTFQGEKTMAGRTLTADDTFTFTIAQVDEQGNVVATLDDKATATGASGVIDYPVITYSLSDLRNEDGTYEASKTFRYTVTEDVPADATATDEAGNAVTYADATDEQKSAGGFVKDGVTYSSDVKTFEVEVTDDGQGTLNAVAVVNADAAMAAAAVGEDDDALAPSRSSAGLTKTATNLDGNYNSTVRVKLQGESAPESQPQEDKPTFDIVFVVDTSQSQGDTASALMNKMFEEAENGGYNVNIGVVKYYYVAQVTRYLDGSAGWNEASSKAGTNLPAGILLGTQLLDEDASVPDDNKYLVVLSDGDTYIYQRGNQLNSYMKGNVLRTNGDDAMVVTQRDSDYNNGTPFAGPGSYSWKYHNGNSEPADFAAPADWNAYFATVGPQVIADAGAYETAWGWQKNNIYSKVTNAIPEDEIFDHACSADTSLYYSLVNYQAASAKYHTYAAFVSGGYNRPYGASFMAYLNGGASLDLSSLGDTLASDIENAATPPVAKGGVIKDTIGYGYDNEGNSYDMDFVNELETTDIIYNGVTLSKAKANDGSFTFGTASDGKPLFTLTYTGKAQPGTEGYTVTFSNEVLATDTVEMRYNVHLDDPQTKTGSYGDYAGTGEPEGTVGLLVSSQATFERDGTTAAFANPVVSYSALGFENAYSATGSVTLEGVKSMEGRDLTADDAFTFEVVEGDETVATGTNDATGKIAFSAIDFTLEDVGTHTYTVKETSEGSNGITADNRERTVTVEVSDKGDGTLAAEVSEGSDPLSFVNTYSASGEGEVMVQKSLVGRDWRTDDAFEFTIAPIGNAPAFANNTVTVTEESADYTESFGKVSFTQAGTYQWTVSETHKGEVIGGVTYDASDKTVTIVVRDDGNGNLVAEEGSDLVQTAAFTNTYSTGDDENYEAFGSVEFVAAKTLVGRTLSADEFSFSLYEGDNLIETASNGGDGYANFAPINYTRNDVGEHSYRIVEEKGDLTGVTYSTEAYEFKTNVTDNGDGTLNVEYADKAKVTDNGDGTQGVEDADFDPEEGVSFTNTYVPSGKVVLEASKALEGATLQADAYTFQVADTTGKVVTTAKNGADGSVKFPELTFHAAGTYRYVISEVVPANAQTLGTNKVANGVAYDEHKTAVTIEAIDNFDGTLRFNVSYDEGSAAFTNTAVPDATFPLSATKVIEGRDFKDGDTFTFSVTASEGAPLPARQQVTITPTSGSEAAVDFGDIVFTTNDLGKSYTYTVSESGAGETVNGVQNDPTPHYVTLTVNDAGDGTMRVDAAYQNDADRMTFTNRYEATGQGVITAQKQLEGRALADNEFFFELTGETLDAPMHAHATTDGTIAFDPITYTQEDVGKDFTYTISETQGTLGGVTYDTSSFDVVVHVADKGDGTLDITYSYPEGEAPVFKNTYRAEATSVDLTAQKMFVGGTMEGGEFSFTLTGTSANAAGVTQTVSNDAAGVVTFDALSYDAAGTYEYRVAEDIPESATDNGDGTFTGADGIVYDGTAHTVVVTVTDNGLGKLEATVAYDGGAAAGISFGNTALARTGFEFDKYFFGGVGTFDFTLTAVNADLSPRAGDEVGYSDALAIVDDGEAAITATVQNGAYSGNVAKVVFPEISFAQDGDYYYLIQEAESSTPDMVADEAQYLAHVVVANGEVTSTTFNLYYDGEDLGATTDLSFYNNSAVTLGFNSLSAMAYTDSAERVSVYPTAQKYLNGSTDQLVGGEFTFELVDDASGETIAVATNDELGHIAFYDEDTDPGLAYSEPGTWTYSIREVAGDEAGVTYDDSVITLVVTVDQTDEGLAATATYNGPGGAEPAFYNTREGMDVEVYKVSRFGGEGLNDCTYALWMVGENGDVLIQEATSDETGRIVFHDVALISGQKYFFKEVEAPDGHTVDPYRTAYFSLNAAGDALVLVEATAADGWHSATENIEIDKAKGEEN